MDKENKCKRQVVYICNEFGGGCKYKPTRQKHISFTTCEYYDSGKCLCSKARKEADKEK